MALLITLSPGNAAPIDELWLAAELAYRADRYADAIALFRAFESHPKAALAPAWQRYLSAHRRSFAALQLGRAREARIALDEAQRVLASAHELRHHGADLDAMRAHLAELGGDFEAAWALFERAYESARECRNRNRARTAASDLGRIAMILKRPSDGLKWLKRARELPGAANAKVMLTIRLREAILQAMLGLHDEALVGFSDVITASRSAGVSSRSTLSAAGPTSIASSGASTSRNGTSRTPSGSRKNRACAATSSIAARTSLLATRSCTRRRARHASFARRSASRSPWPRLPFSRSDSCSKTSLRSPFS